MSIKLEKISSFSNIIVAVSAIIAIFTGIFLEKQSFLEQRKLLRIN